MLTQLFLIQVRLNRLKEFVDGKAKVLICTDIASRGIDTSKARTVHLVELDSRLRAGALVSVLLQVTQVILYDFPYTLADYIHRIGRTGRVGMSAQCRAVCFMTHRRDIHMAWMIKVGGENHFMNDSTAVVSSLFLFAIYSIGCCRKAGGHNEQASLQKIAID